ncbi:MAG TPA: outer membrane beta-barrel protein [Terriglobales bacterium]|nr:outer membrane beta-barrel protein [Terriglobales bacterium]
MGKRAIQQWCAGLALGLAMAAAAAAQVNPPVAPNIPPPGATPPSPFGGNSEIFVGGGFTFPKATTANANPVATTNVASLDFGYLYHVTDNSAFELHVGFWRPVQVYQTTTSVQARDNEITFNYVWTYPTDGFIRPFFLGGVGVIRYSPSGANNPPQAASQQRAVVVYGGGLDFRLSHSWSIRAEYRGLLYRVPDFTLISISKWNHTPAPDIGLVYHF